MKQHLQRYGIVYVLLTVFVATFLITRTAHCGTPVPSSIGIVDNEKLVRSSRYMQGAQEDLQKKLQELQQRILPLSNEVTILQGKVKDYEKDAPPATLERIKKDLADKTTALQRSQEDGQRIVQADQQSFNSKVTKLVKQAVVDVAKKRHLDLIVVAQQSFLYWSDAIDITADVAQWLDQQPPEKTADQPVDRGPKSPADTKK